jgi:hypothetical protein
LPFIGTKIQKRLAHHFGLGQGFGTKHGAKYEKYPARAGLVSGYWIEEEFFCFIQNLASSIHSRRMAGLASSKRIFMPPTRRFEVELRK